MNCILVDIRENEDRVAIMEENKLVEFYLERVNRQKIVGNIYRGRVVNVLPGMEAAFVDIGLGKNAYLYLKDAVPKEMMSKKLQDIYINDVVKTGQEIIVQVIKEAFQNKGPKITTHITLPGRYVVLTPFINCIGISRRITEKREIKRLKKIAMELKMDDMGLIIRTACKGKQKESIQKDLNLLIKLYKKIKREKNFIRCPKLLYRDLDLVHQIVRDVYTNSIDKLIVNDKNKYQSILELLDLISPPLKNKVIFSDNKDIFKEYNIEKDIKKALERKVSLSNGGYIVIDETEALTSIDVNTGKYVGKLNLEDTIVNTNIQAAREIAKQIRLRDIGGIIIIDFIDMRNKKDEMLILKVLQESLKKDRNRTNIVDITKLGLVEITRKKVRNKLTSKLMKDCPHCKGRGKILIEDY